MSIPSKQIGWSNESNLLWEISKQMERLTKVVYANSGGSSTYKVYTATVTYLQGDTLLNVNVLENTLGGSLTFVLDFQSEFIVTSSGLFTLDKTFVLMNSPEDGTGTYAKVDSINQLTVNFDSYGNDPFGEVTGFIEIRVYN